MSATSRLKQLLFLIASLALIAVGLTGLATAAQADDTTGGEPCVETQDSFTEWVNEGAVIQTVANTPPGADTDTVRYLPAGTVQVGNGDGVAPTPATPGAWWNFSPNRDQGPLQSAPSFPTDSRGTWQGPHTVGGPSQDLVGTFQQGAGNAPWFHREAGTPGTPGQAETFHTEYLWQKQVRTFVPGNDCPDEEPEGKKVVVCKYVGAPPGTPDHIIVVSVASLGDGFTGTFPYAFGDAQDSVAIRFAVGNEQPGDEELANCPRDDEPAECPDGDHNGDAEGCEEEPEECPDGDHNGEAEGCEEDDDEECPKGTDNAGQEILEGENAEDVCNDDDPIIDPGEGEEPGKNPGNNSNDPGNNSNNPQGSNQPNNGVTPVSAPGAQVPSAVNAGLAPTQRELFGTGNSLGLVGMSTVLLGLGLLGLTLRPRRGRKLAG